ncbi:GerAB/ArcD/ProY family transporter [Bacillus thuringiensis]|nr:GerAB/ArcD/ProY family transporter [Bacillus thuringiensis]
MPRDIANQTLFSDGWIILLLGGLICAVLGWFVTRWLSYFQNKILFNIRVRI